MILKLCLRWDGDKLPCIVKGGHMALDYHWDFFWRKDRKRGLGVSTHDVGIFGNEDPLEEDEIQLDLIEEFTLPISCKNRWRWKRTSWAFQRIEFHLNQSPDERDINQTTLHCNLGFQMASIGTHCLHDSHMDEFDASSATSQPTWHANMARNLTGELGAHGACGPHVPIWKLSIWKGSHW